MCRIAQSLNASATVKHPQEWPRLDDTMQKAAAYDMPLAVGVARDLTKLPFQKTMSFYSWSPDTTFWSLDPTRIIFPPNDFSAHLNGDKRTAGADSLVAKIVSQDWGLQ